MHQKQDTDWSVNELPGQRGFYATDQAHLAVLMDIRAELRRVRSVLECGNALAIPDILRDIRRNTKKAKRKVKK